MKNFSSRERYSIIFVSTALILGYLWQPWSQQVQQAQLLVNEQLETLAWMQQAAKEIATLRTQRPTTTTRSSTSLFSIIDNSMAQSPLAKIAKRIEPNGEQEVRISFEQVNFSELIRWLSNLQQQRLQIYVATLEKINTNDMVKVQLTVKDAAF